MAEERLSPPVVREVKLGKEFSPFEHISIDFHDDKVFIQTLEEFRLEGIGRLDFTMISDWFMDVEDNWNGLNVNNGEHSIGIFDGTYFHFTVSLELGEEDLVQKDLECELTFGKSKRTALNGARHDDPPSDLAIFNDWFDEKGELSPVIILKNQIPLLPHFKIKFVK